MRRPEPPTHRRLLLLSLLIGLAVVPISTAHCAVPRPLQQDATADATPEPAQIAPGSGDEQAAEGEAAAPDPQDVSAALPSADTLAEPGSAEITLESLQADKQKIEASTSLAESTRTAALAELQAAADALTRAAASDTTTAQYRADVQAAPQLVEQIQADLATPQEQTDPVRKPGSTLAEVQNERDAAAAALVEAQGARDRFQATATRRSERRLAIDGEMVAAQAKLDALLGALEAPSSGDQDPAVLDAQRQRLLAEIQEARALQARLDAEQDRNQAEEQLITLRLDLARRHARAAEVTLEAWDKILREGRSQEAAEAVEKAAKSRTALALKHADLKEVIDAIDSLSAELTGPDSVVTQMNTASEELTHYTKEYLRIRTSFQDTLERFRVAGATQALGFFLRLEYDKLPDPGRLRIESRRRQKEASEALYRVLVLNELRGGLGDVGERVQELVDKAGGFPTEEDKQAFITAATSLCSNERDLSESLRRSNEDYAEILQRTDSTVADLIVLTEHYETFIRQHILWQRSVDRPFDLEPPVVLGGLDWIVSGDKGDVEGLVMAVGSLGLLVALYALVIVLMFLIRRRVRARIAELAPLVSSYRTDSLTYTFKVLLYSLIAALPFPALVYGGSWVLEETGTASQWRSSWATSMGAATSYLLALCLALEVLRKNGLARTHLRWPEDACRRLGVLLIEFLAPIWLIVLTQHTLQIYGETPYRDTTGRLMFIATFSLMSVFVFRLLSPRGAVLQPYYSRHPDSLLSKTRGGVHFVGVTLSAAIVLLAVFGYYFTARVLAQGLVGTLILSLLVSLMVGLANRWQVYHRRRLAYTQALERRAEREAGGAEPEIAEYDESLDISTIDAKTRSLISNCATAVLVIGLLSIWSNALPALQVLERVQLLPTLGVLPESTTSSDWEIPGVSSGIGGPPASAAGSDTAAAAPAGDNGAAAPAAPATPSMPGMGMMSSQSSTTAATSAAYRLSLADVLAALLILLVTGIVIRNGPALLELGVLTRLHIDAGARYAITTLIRYALFTIGGTLAFNALGVGWASVQWLAAAMTFGLAFGLQEIFANFISGLILLVERPIRIGDTVTIGNLTGTVGRIRPRATTILDFDNRERLIPNKSLITDEVINWTLSSSVTRQIASVGVAYGTDTSKVFENLMRAATECPHAMSEPSPSVLFKGFGESTLDFDLRFYIPDRDRWVDAVNDVNIRIDKLFKAAEIEIAFPQRDLHLRSSDVPFKDDQPGSAVSEGAPLPSPTSRG